MKQRPLSRLTRAFPGMRYVLGAALFLTATMSIAAASPEELGTRIPGKPVRLASVQTSPSPLPPVRVAVTRPAPVKLPHHACRHVRLHYKRRGHAPVIKTPVVPPPRIDPVPMILLPTVPARTGYSLPQN